MSIVDHVHPFCERTVPIFDRPCLEHDTEVSVLKWLPWSPDPHPVEKQDVAEEEINIMDV